MDKATIQANIQRFEKLLSGVQKTGVESLIDFIRKSDFYIAPASTRFHLAEEGGLLAHSLHVYDRLMAKKNDPLWAEELSKYTDSTLVIVSLLHDICKTYFYVKEPKNQKTYDKEKVKAAPPKTVKHDDNGDFIWETVMGYSIDDKYPLGHGNKSCAFITQCMPLSMTETAAITWHMGAYCDSSLWNSLGNAYEKWSLALALHEADLEASYLLEKKTI